MLTQKQIEHVEKTLGYTFRDKSLLVQAFVRSSFCNERDGARLQSNEVLEFFGDSVLSAVLVSIFIRDFAKRDAFGIRTDYGEGELSTLKSNLSDKKNLSRSMRELGLAEYLLMGNGDKKEAIGAQASVMEDLYESLLGAVYIDCDKDMQTMIRVVERTLDTSVFLHRCAPQKSYKNLLQEYCQEKTRRLPLPTYEVLRKEGPEHDSRVLCACLVGGKMLGQGWGKNEKEAENAAAGVALQSLREEAEIATARSPHPTKNRPIRSHEYPAARLRIYAKAHPELGELVVHDAEKDPASQDHTPRFFYSYTLGNKTATGEGGSIADAKHDAAQKMLEMLGVK